MRKVISATSRPTSPTPSSTTTSHKSVDSLLKESIQKLIKKQPKDHITPCDDAIAETTSRQNIAPPQERLRLANRAVQLNTLKQYLSKHPQVKFLGFLGFGNACDEDSRCPIRSGVSQYHGAVVIENGIIRIECFDSAWIYTTQPTLEQLKSKPTVQVIDENRDENMFDYIGLPNHASGAQVITERGHVSLIEPNGTVDFGLYTTKVGTKSSIVIDAPLGQVHTVTVMADLDLSEDENKKRIMHLGQKTNARAIFASTGKDQKGDCFRLTVIGTTELKSIQDTLKLWFTQGAPIKAFTPQQAARVKGMMCNFACPDRIQEAIKKAGITQTISTSFSDFHQYSGSGNNDKTGIIYFDSQLKEDEIQKIQAACQKLGKPIGEISQNA
jgi:hypothetical protein